MPMYQVAYNKTTRVALIQNQGTAVPAGSVNVGTFEHADAEAQPAGLEFDVNHVFVHHVRDLLYKRKPDGSADGKFPNNMTDVDRVQIKMA